jgi:single-strand DNA-binding protein
MNNVTISGKVWDPEIRYASSGMCIATVNVSVYDGKDRDTQKAKYFNIKVIAFKEQAELMGNSIVKGDRVIVSGRLSEEKWEKDGKTNRRTTLIAETIGKELQVQKLADFGQFGSDVTDEIQY